MRTRTGCRVRGAPISGLGFSFYHLLLSPRSVESEAQHPPGEERSGGSLSDKDRKKTFSVTVKTSITSAIPRKPRTLGHNEQEGRLGNPKKPSFRPFAPPGQPNLSSQNRAKDEE